MRPELDDLTFDDIKVGGETIKEPDKEVETVEDSVETTEVDTSTTETTEEQVEETKVEAAKEETKVETATETVDVFPSERFGGKFQSWEEVKAALNEPKTEFKDDFIKKVVDKYNQDGSLEDFFKAYSTDWDKMSDQDVLRKQFFEENADMDDEKAIERLWKKELSKYTIDADEYDQEDVETGLALMKRDAKKVREKFKERQQEYLQPSTKTEHPDDSERIEALQRFVNDDPVVKTIKESKIVSLDIDGEKYNFEVDEPQIIADSLVNENIFYNQFVKNGKPDTAKWAEVMAYATNPSKFRKSLVDYGRSLERKAMEDELKNTKLPKQESQKSGSTGDEKEDLLNAFVTKGKIVKR